jgi:hypothetical protein
LPRHWERGSPDDQCAIHNFDTNSQSDAERLAHAHAHAHAHANANACPNADADADTVTFAYAGHHRADDHEPKREPGREQPELHLRSPRCGAWLYAGHGDISANIDDPSGLKVVRLYVDFVGGGNAESGYHNVSPTFNSISGKWEAVVNPPNFADDSINGEIRWFWQATDTNNNFTQYPNATYVSTTVTGCLVLV